MRNLIPIETAYWCVYDVGLDILHTGVTEPGQVTSTNAGPIELDEAAMTRLETHKAKLEESTEPSTSEEEIEVRAGFFLYNDEVVLLRKEDCVDKRHLYEAVRDRRDAIAATR